MFSGYPPSLPSDFMLENLSNTFNGVYTPWDSAELFPSPESHESIVSNSSSDVIQSPAPVFPSQTSDLKEIDRDEVIISERNQRRRMSNRESAKRSRERKQKHLATLKNQVNGLMIEKHELSNRLLLVLYQNQCLRNETDQFLSEYSILRRKLSDLRRLLARRQFHEPTYAWLGFNEPLFEQTTNLIGHQYF